MDDRLTKPDWIRHGLRTVAQSGMGGLKVGAMAKGLNVSRGSFYWHFTDIDDFCTQLLDSWQKVTTDQVMLELSEEASPDRLKLLMERAFARTDQLDRAIRLWAAQDHKVAAVTAQVDDKRTAYISALLVAAGISEQQADERAKFIYWAYLGQSLAQASGDTVMDAPAIAGISALFEA